MPTVDEQAEKHLANLTKKIRGRHKTRENKKAFLRAFYVHNCRVVTATSAVGISKRVIYEWRAKDPVFSKAMDDVRELFRAKLESLVIEEAEMGNDKMIALAARKLVPEFADEPAVQITNNQLINPDRSHEEKLLRAREVMHAIGFTVTDDVIEGEINTPKIEHKP